MLSLCVLLFAGCDESAIDITYGESIEIPEEFLDVQLESGVTNEEITFTAIAPWELSISETTKAVPDWISITPMSGDAGEVTLSLVLDKKIGTEQRSASISIVSNGETVNIRYNTRGGGCNLFTRQ